MLLLAVLAGLTFWIGAAVALDAYGRRSVPEMTYDAIVVPGCKVWAGGQPSNALRRRVTHAVSLYHQGRAPYIITTGGVGTHPPAEAQVAADIARSGGVPDTAILCEDRSTNTRENASFAAALTHQGAPISGWHVLVVSDAYHAWRCARLFGAHFGRATARGSTPGWRLRVRGSLREVISIVLGMLRN
jgi:uncharacterized SAM-binding protein YcdF (DUF218 family)